MTNYIFPNIEKLVLENDKYYRQVLNTTPTQQLVIMNIEKGKDIGLETHKKVTQFFKIVKGTGTVQINDDIIKIKKDDVIVVPPNTKHNVISKTGLKLYTIYSPPVHDENAKILLKNKS